ncbi:replication initiation protein, RepL2 [Streptomyces sp. SAI-163]|uniref:replication initiation protein, RepL2 n=2 Tax=unclassified Streptomyces TaxID=2593676 RepID=UPI003C7C9CD1
MTSSEDKQQNLELLEKAVGMTTAQRSVVMLYALHPDHRSGAVLETALNLAKRVGMAPPVFSRTRQQIIEVGWLKETGRLGHIKYLRPDPRRMGENVAIPLRRAT